MCCGEFCACGVCFGSGRVVIFDCVWQSVACVARVVFILLLGVAGRGGAERGLVLCCAVYFKVLCVMVI